MQLVNSLHNTLIQHISLESKSRLQLVSWFFLEKEETTLNSQGEENTKFCWVKTSTGTRRWHRDPKKLRLFTQRCQGSWICPTGIYDPQYDWGIFGICVNHLTHYKIHALFSKTHPDNSTTITSHGHPGAHPTRSPKRWPPPGNPNRMNAKTHDLWTVAATQRKNGGTFWWGNTGQQKGWFVYFLRVPKQAKRDIRLAGIGIV